MSPTSSTPPERRVGPGGKLLASAATAAVLALGILVLGRFAPGVTSAMASTAGWFALVGTAALVVARRRRALLLPLAAAFILVGGAAAVVLALPMFVDREVDEQVVMAAAAPPARSGPPESETPARPARRQNVLLAAGAFRPREHAVEGQARLIRLAGGGSRLTFTGFEVDNGPDLRVYLVTGAATGEGDVGDVEDLGALKGNRGDQQYTVPRDLDLRRYDTAVIWCRAFSVNFAAARLAD